MFLVIRHDVFAIIQILCGLQAMVADGENFFFVADDPPCPVIVEIGFRLVLSMQNSRQRRIEAKSINAKAQRCKGAEP
jgi:hypothetical protein